jgi:hypothetical protein
MFEYWFDLVRDRIEMNMKIIDRILFVQINVDLNEDIQLNQRIPLIEDFV